MELSGYFADFIQNIRIPSEQLKEMREQQLLLRARLEKDKDLASCLVTTFLHGSQRRGTSHRPPPKKKADVDVIVVTKIDKDRVSAKDALQKFVPFLERNYKGRYEPQGRSFAIDCDHIKLDMVPTSSPSEVEMEILLSKAAGMMETPDELPDWRLVKSWVPPGERGKMSSETFVRKLKAEQDWRPEPLWIPDRDANKWERTHPLGQIQWTWIKNASCNGHFIHTVQSGKWWRCSQRPTPKYPKGYPLENLIGHCCPDGVTSIAQAFTASLEKIVELYGAHAVKKEVPFVPDHGIKQNNVLARVSGADFAAFYGHVVEAAALARKALDAQTVKASAELWGQLFGAAFPVPPPEPEERTGGYTPRKDVSVVGGGRFA